MQNANTIWFNKAYELHMEQFLTFRNAFHDFHCEHIVHPFLYLFVYLILFIYLT